jgi:hypothetical protein
LAIGGLENKPACFSRQDAKEDAKPAKKQTKPK